MSRMAERVTRLEKMSGLVEMPDIVVELVGMDGSTEVHHALIWDASARQYEMVSGHRAANLDDTGQSRQNLA